MSETKTETLAAKANARGEWNVIGEHGPIINGSVYPDSHDEQSARLMAAAMNSYRRHFGINAVQAAEDDVLGDALDVCRRLLREDEDGEYTIGLIEDASDVLSRLPSSKE